MVHDIELRSPVDWSKREKDELYENYEQRLLYANKAEIYGCCINLLTDSPSIKNKWETQNEIRSLLSLKK